MKKAHNRVEMVGKKYGYWEVLAYSHTINKISFYSCKCTYPDCGKRYIVDGRNVRNGRSRQCSDCGVKAGALTRTGVKKSKATNEEQCIKYLYNDKKKSAITRGIQWALTMEEFKSIIFKNCHYTGLPPSTTTDVLKYQGLCDKWNGSITYNGIDRVDSSKGYIMENCVPCNTDINRMKLDHSADKFFELIKSVVKHQNWTKE